MIQVYLQLSSLELLILTEALKRSRKSLKSACSLERRRTYRLPYVATKDTLKSFNRLSKRLNKARVADGLLRVTDTSLHLIRASFIGSLKDYPFTKPQEDIVSSAYGYTISIDPMISTDSIKRVMARFITRACKEMKYPICSAKQKCACENSDFPECLK